MKKFYFVFALSLLVLMGCNKGKDKAIEKFVFDFENVLNDEQEAALDGLFRAHEMKTTNEIVLVTTDTFGVEDNIIKYAMAFGNENGIGKKEKNNGIVIVFSKSKRRTRILTGFGLEDVLTDPQAQQIVDSLMIPQFKAGNYYTGILNASTAITDFLEGKKE